MEQLRPCPFCGGDVEMWDRTFGVVTVFECKHCMTRFVFPWNKEPSEWNNRNDSGEQFPERKQLESGCFQN